MKIKFFILGFLNLLVINIYSQTTGFLGKNAWLYDSVLASKDFEGRKSGAKGAEKAIKWISEKFKEWGLKGGGENGTYVQRFPILFTEEITVPKLTIKNVQRGKLDLVEGDDFVLFTNSGSGKVESDIVFVGYGLNEKEWDDYKEIDVKGKIIFMFDGAPEKIRKELDSPTDRNSKFKIAGAKGAAGVLMLRSYGFNPVKGAAIVKENYNQNLLGAYILDWVAREIFKGTGKTIEELRDSLSKHPQSFNTNKKAVFEARLKKVDNTFGENVIGVIPGSDPMLKDEYIIFGAHMDHIGKSPNGYIYYGADDNGSGTSVVMELARSLAASDIKFNRSIMFIGFGAEEQGLLGSNYFVENPVIPKNKISLMINFDMVGVGNGGFGIAGVESIRNIWNEFWDTLSDEEKKKIQLSRAGLGGSDYTPFKIAGIPSLTSYSTGSHRYYHVVEDDYKYIQPEVLDFVGKTYYKLAAFLSGYPRRLMSQYREERTFLMSCSSTDLSEKIFGTDAFSIDKRGRQLSEKGIKLVSQNFIDFDSSISCSNILKKIDDYFEFKKREIIFTTFTINGSEVRNNINGSKVNFLPVIKGTTRDTVLLKSLIKFGFKNYKVDYKHSMMEDIFKFIKIIAENKGAIEIQLDKDNIIDISKIPDGTNVLLSGDAAAIEHLSVNFMPLIKEKNLICILYVAKEEISIDRIISIAKRTGSKNLHIDTSQMYYENESFVFELIKNMRNEKFTDDDLRNIFGENIVRGL